MHFDWIMHKHAFVEIPKEYDTFFFFQSELYNFVNVTFHLEINRIKSFRLEMSSHLQNS